MPLSGAEHSLKRVVFRIRPSYGKRICEPGWRWDQQQPFEDYDIFYVLAGRGEMRLGDERYVLQKNCCLVLRPGDLPKAVQDPHDRLTVLYLHFHVFSPEAGTVPDFPFPRFTAVGGAFPAEDLLQRIMDLLDVPASFQALEFDCLMKLFFIQLFRVREASLQSSPFSPRQLLKVRRIATYIRESGGVGVTRERLSRLVSMSPEYMSRLFKACTGTTLKQYITRAKMEKAKQLLSENRLNVSEVAERLGYSDAFAFSKSFKQVHGVSPSEYLAGRRLPTKAGGSPKS